MYTVDLHTHTRFFHPPRGKPTAFDPIGARLLSLCARRQNLDGVALTNHDYYPDVDTTGPQPQFIPGIEVSTTIGHILVVGANPPIRTTPQTHTPEEIVSLAHERGCAAIIAHPFRRSRVRESDADFDAVEINGKHPDNADRVRKLAASLDLPIVAGSDAHYPFEVGRAVTRIQATALTPDAVVDAIRDGNVEPCIRTTPLDAAMRTAYRYIHALR
ncbi:PHP-associated domain-containing protein [Halalkalirubrum salinum]|uniref:PHP-associated domain-containing protein n=1 Tax=Halalkalirubrum salinum TaxID=2563889 RepID=UPI0010FBBB42|nr:PHP-associated domain-containing protein [Halalkalirubrum salinum]